MPARENCGVVGVSLQGKGAAPYLFRGLRALQHRGQESAGIATTSHGTLYHRKGMGLVHEIFGQELLDTLRGSVGIGHVRYSTTGSSDLENAQPIVVKIRDQDGAIAHNGDIVNFERVRKRLKAQGESTWMRIVLSEGRNREIRRMLARLEHKVMRLRRIALGPVQLGHLGKGKARKLSLAELKALRHAARQTVPMEQAQG